MTTDKQLNERISKWLEADAPGQMPDRVLLSTFERTRKSRQHGGWYALLGRLGMPKFAPALASAAIVVVVAALALNVYFNSSSGFGNRPVTSYTSADGEVTVSAPSSWTMWWPEQSHLREVGVWFGMMFRSDSPVIAPYAEGSVGFVDPVAYDAWCEANGGSPLLSGPADAAAIAQQLSANPNFETTPQGATRIGGLNALSMDVSLAPGGKTCGIYAIVISRWVHQLEPGIRLRLYLVDLPDGMSVHTLAITVHASDDRFQDVIQETAPIIRSIEFHAP